MKEDAWIKRQIFSKWSSEDQPDFFLLELWNKVIRAADCMESCGRWVSSAVMIKLLGKSYRERKKERKVGRRERGVVEVLSQLQIIFHADTGLHDLIERFICVCQQQSPFTREIHHEGASFLFLSGWDCLIYVPLNAREVCADWIAVRLIQIYVRKWIWHYHGQALSADIYSSSSSLVILTSPRAVFEGKKNGCRVLTHS